MAEAVVLELQDVTLSLGGRPVLDHLSCTAKPASVTALLGPNGAGKTTTIRCCTGLMAPDSGRISVLGELPGSSAVTARVGFMPQATGAWSGVTARRLLTYLARLYQTPHPPTELIGQLRLDAFADTPYRRLSGGQQQLVNLAGALIGRPELLFLDEPTAGLDPHARRDVWQVISELAASGVAVLLTTHAMDEAATLAARVLIMDRGRITLSGSVAELTSSGSLEEAFLSHTTRSDR